MSKNKIDLSISLNLESMRMNFGRRRKIKENSSDLNIDYDDSIYLSFKDLDRKSQSNSLKQENYKQYLEIFNLFI